MKKKIIVILILLIPLFVSGQTWKSTIDLNISVDTDDVLDLYTNADGNHVLWHDGSEVNYYHFTYNGSQIRSSSIISSISEYPKLARMNGYLDTVYVSYKNGDYIYTKRSVNAGQSWSSMQVIELSSDVSNGMELWCNANGLHVAWSEYDDNNSKYNSWYQRLPNNSVYWTDTKRVTDTSGDEGGFPSVTTSSERVHVSYTQGDALTPQYNYSDSKTRDKYNTTWQTPQSTSSNTMRTYIISDNSKLHLFYFDFVMGM